MTTRTSPRLRARSHKRVSACDPERANLPRAVSPTARALVPSNVPAHIIACILTARKALGKPADRLGQTGGYTCGAEHAMPPQASTAILARYALSSSLSVVFPPAKRMLTQSIAAPASIHALSHSPLQR